MVYESITLPILARRHAAFIAGRDGLWDSEAPIAADGTLRDLLADAQDKALEAVQELGEARRSAPGFADRDLAAAEGALRKALATIADLRTRLASVPADFGGV